MLEACEFRRFEADFAISRCGSLEYLCNFLQIVRKLSNILITLMHGLGLSNELLYTNGYQPFSLAEPSRGAGTVLLYCVKAAAASGI